MDEASDGTYCSCGCGVHCAGVRLVRRRTADRACPPASVSSGTYYASTWGSSGARVRCHLRTGAFGAGRSGGDCADVPISRLNLISLAQAIARNVPFVAPPRNELRYAPAGRRVTALRTRGTTRRRSQRHDRLRQFVGSIAELCVDAGRTATAATFHHQDHRGHVRRDRRRPRTGRVAAGV